jgi:hypothetical protein
MFFHDFARFFGKFGKNIIHLPKLCAGLGQGVSSGSMEGTLPFRGALRVCRVPLEARKALAGQ